MEIFREYRGKDQPFLFLLRLASLLNTARNNQWGSILNIVLFSQNEFVDNVRVHEQLERTKTSQITKRHLMQLRLKLDNLKEAMSKNWHVT